MPRGIYQRKPQMQSIKDQLNRKELDLIHRIDTRARDRPKKSPAWGLFGSWALNFDWEHSAQPVH